MPIESTTSSFVPHSHIERRQLKYSSSPSRNLWFFSWWWWWHQRVLFSISNYIMNSAFSFACACVPENFSVMLMFKETFVSCKWKSVQFGYSWTLSTSRYMLGLWIYCSLLILFDLISDFDLCFMNYSRSDYLEFLFVCATFVGYINFI